MEKIKFGFVPRDMDDKWFIYYAEDEEILYLHRSWTGFCVFMVKFKEVDGGFAAMKAVVNEDPEQYKCGDNANECMLVLPNRVGHWSVHSLLVYCLHCHFGTLSNSLLWERN